MKKLVRQLKIRQIFRQVAFTPILHLDILSLQLNQNFGRDWMGIPDLKSGAPDWMIWSISYGPYYGSHIISLTLTNKIYNSLTFVNETGFSIPSCARPQLYTTNQSSFINMF